MNDQAIPVRPSDRDMGPIVDHLMGLNMRQLKQAFERTRVLKGFTVGASQYFDRVRKTAAESKCEYFSCQHMLLCAIEDNSGLLAYCLKVAGLDLIEVTNIIRNQISSIATQAEMRARRIGPTPSAKDVLRAAYDEMSERDGKGDITISHICLALLKPRNGPHRGVLASIGLDTDSMDLVYDVALRTFGYLTAREEKILAAAEEVLAKISIPRSGKIPQVIKTPMPDAMTAEVKWPPEFSAIFIACARENKGNVTVDLLQRMLDRLERKRNVADANTPSTSD